MITFKLAKTSTLVFLTVLILSSHLFGADKPEFIYKFIEAENAKPQLKERCFRKTGFTWFMGIPSGGKVVVFSDNANSKDSFGTIKFPVKDLPAGKYNVWVRQLNWKKIIKKVEKTANTAIHINGKKIGETSYPPQLSWALRWANVGSIKLDGKAFKLTVTKTEDNAQAPYLDLLLLTNDLKYVPESVDQDYRSFKRVESGIRIKNVELKGDDGIVAFYAPKKFKNCKLQLRFFNKKLRKLYSMSSSVSISKGLNNIKLSTKILPKGKYPLKALITSADNVVFSTAEFLAEKKQEWKVIPNNYYLIKTDKRAKVSVNINFKMLAKKIKQVKFTVFDGTSNLINISKPLAAAAMEFEFDVKSLSPGKYQAKIELLDNKQEVIETFEYPLIKSSIAGDFPKLEPIKKVEISEGRIKVNGRFFVPRKLFHTSSNKKFKDQGYNIVDVWGNEKSIITKMDKTWKDNMYATVVLWDPYFYNAKTHSFNIKRIKQLINKIKHHPAVFGWRLFDEPDAHKFPPAKLKAAVDAIRECDNSHPILIDLCSYSPAILGEYAGFSDIAGFNVYPIPNNPITMLSKGLDILDAAVIKANPQRVISITMQTYGYTTGRMPTPDEYRAMFYLALNHGARMFGDYSYKESPGYPYCLKADKFLWSYMRVFNREMLVLNDLIAGGERIATPKIRCSSPAIDWACWKVGGKKYLTAVNTKPKKTVTKFTLPKGYSKVEVILENRNSSTEKAAFKDTFAPYEAHVYLLKN